MKPFLKHKKNILLIFSIFVSNKFSKMKGISNLVAGLLLFFTPIKGLILAVGLAIMFDTFTGIFKSVKLKGWRSIKSRKLSDIVGKMALYELSIICLYPIDFYLLNELTLMLIDIQFFCTKLACVILILIEITSIKENINAAFGIDIWSIIKNFIKRSKEISEDVKDIKG